MTKYSSFVQFDNASIEDISFFQIQTVRSTLSLNTSMFEMLLSKRLARVKPLQSFKNSIDVTQHLVKEAPAIDVTLLRKEKSGISVSIKPTLSSIGVLKLVSW